MTDESRHKISWQQFPASSPCSSLYFTQFLFQFWNWSKNGKVVPKFGRRVIFLLYTLEWTFWPLVDCIFRILDMRLVSWPRALRRAKGSDSFFIFPMQLLGLWCWWRWWRSWRWWQLRWWRWQWCRWMSKILIEAAPVWSIKAKMHFYVPTQSYWFFLSSECLKLFSKTKTIIS